MESAMVGLTIAMTILSVAAICMNTTGVYLLLKPNPIHTIQVFYLGNLSVLEVFLVLLQNASLYVGLFAANETQIQIFEYVDLAMFAAGFVWVHILIMLTFDRFLQVYLNIKYNLYITEGKAKVIICFSYLLGILLGLVLVILNIVLRNALDIVRFFLFPVYGGAICVMFAFTYMYIYRKLRGVRPSMPSVEQQERRGKSAIFIPFWISLSFIAFVFIPNAAFIFFRDRFPKNYRLYIWRLCWQIDYVTDAFIYMFLNDLVRKRFLRLVRRRRELPGEGGRSKIGAHSSTRTDN